MKALILDDEIPARVELRRLLSLHPSITQINEAETVKRALELTDLHQPDLVFLDVHLRGETGFDYLARLPEGTSTPRIIFLTAHDRYAIRAFECNALDYLLKPVAPDRLAKSLQRLPRSTPPPTVTEDDTLFVKTGNSARFIPWREIHAITADGNYTHLHLADGSQCIVLRPLKEWLSLAPTGHFLQAHRSALVQKRAILGIHPLGEKKRVILLPCERQIPLGREYASQFKGREGR